jgi:hypothetical protein
MKKLIYKNLPSLASAQKVLAEAAKAVHDPERTISTSDIPEILGAAVGSVAGIGLGVAMVSSAGSVAGLGAAGITSGLATLGGVVGQGMVAGIFVAGAPMAVLGIAGYAAISARNSHRLRQEKERLYQEAIVKLDAVQRELNQKVDLSKQRAEYLNALNIKLREIIDNLEKDLEKCKAPETSL